MKVLSFAEEQHPSSLKSLRTTCSCRLHCLLGNPGLLAIKLDVLSLRNMMSPPVYANAETLIVDREPFLRRVVQQYLRQAGIQRVSEADDSDSVLACIRKNPVELLIGDWNVLTSNEEFLLHNIKNWANVRGRFAFLIMMHEARESHVRRAIDHGADAIVLKPFSANRFWSCAGSALNARRKRVAEARSLQTA